MKILIGQEISTTKNDDLIRIIKSKSDKSAFVDIHFISGFSRQIVMMPSLSRAKEGLIYFVFHYQKMAFIRGAVTGEKISLNNYTVQIILPLKHNLLYFFINLAALDPRSDCPKNVSCKN